MHKRWIKLEKLKDTHDKCLIINKDLKFHRTRETAFEVKIATNKNGVEYDMLYD